MSVPLSMRSGLHARPAAKIAQEAQRYESDIRILGAEETADAKSMLDILTLDTTPDASVTFLAQGEDARQALSGLAVCLDAVQQSDG
ncbi:MAG: HPr family phosphocarrier protein [Desulfovibrio sp.]|nr:HPr family phosphocarrier protein [Desulfovibrio sp.]